MNEKGAISDKVALASFKHLPQTLVLEGKINLKHYRGGALLSEVEMPNLIVDSGLNEIAKLISSNGTGTRFSAMAIGSSSTPEANNQTALGNELMRVSAPQTINNNVVTFSGTFNFTSSMAISEAGIFNSTTPNAGVMLARKAFNVLNFENGDSLVITWTVTVGRA